MDKLLKIKGMLPTNVQLLIRTDVNTGEWFIHLYTKKIGDCGLLVKDETIIKEYCSDENVEGVLDRISKWCLENKSEKIERCDKCENYECKSHKDWEGDRIDEVFCKSLDRIVYHYCDEWDVAIPPDDCPVNSNL